MSKVRNKFHNGWRAFKMLIKDWQVDIVDKWTKDSYLDCGKTQTRNQINKKSNNTHQQEKDSNSIEKWAKYQ